MSAPPGPAVGIVGQSAALARALGAARRASGASDPVLVLGERGTGKELFARWIHEASPRAKKAMVIVNCASLTPELANAQLFGHTRGAFTGAVSAREGYVGAAEGGTLFLDEVGELSLEVQACLLRLLQERTIVAVGERREKAVDVRVIAATNRDLHALARAGRFREDLLDRLRVWEVRLPPLRDRKGDLAEIAEAFLARAPDLKGRNLRLGRGAVLALRAHDWPGNVRELQRVLLRAAAQVSDGEAIPGRVLGSVLAEDTGRDAPAPRTSDALVLDAVAPGERLRMGALASRTGLPRSTVKAATARLVAAGRLARSGAGRATRYGRAGAGYQEAAHLASVHPLAEAVVRLLETAGPCGCPAVAGALQVSPSTALRALTALVDAGVVARWGQARTTRYGLAGRERGEAARPSLSASASSPPSRPEPAETASPAPPAVAHEAPGPRTDLEEVALGLARTHGAVARRDLVRAASVSPRTALRALRRLTEARALVADGGRGCATRYSLPGRSASVSPRMCQATPRAALRSGSPRTAAPRQRRSVAELGFALALVLALQQGQVRPGSLGRRAGVPVEEARASLEALAARGLLLPAGDAYVLAPYDPRLDDP